MCGSLGCGRRMYDGSILILNFFNQFFFFLLIFYIKKIGGGNGHGMVHYKETNHSLVVKLGTITSSGASVHCYSCDDEVIDHNLRDHLANFGIDIEK